MNADRLLDDILFFQAPSILDLVSSNRTGWPFSLPTEKLPHLLMGREIVGV